MPPERFELTHREQQVLILMGQGLNNKQIAEALGVSVRTVHHFIYGDAGGRENGGIFGVFGTRSRVKAVSRAVEKGVIYLYDPDLK